MFANGSGDQGSILGWVIPMTQKMVLGAALLNTQHYKVKFGLVSLFNGISTFVGYLMPKPFS